MWRTLGGAGALVVRDNCVLMVAHEREGRVRWELPSGLVGPGESLEDTAARETMEETCVLTRVGRLLCTVVIDVPAEQYRGLNAYFCAQALDDRPPEAMSDEPIVRAAYLDLLSLQPQEMHPVDRRILRLWQRNPSRPPFHFRIVL